MTDENARYLLFAGLHSIPALGLEIAPDGGWNDYQGAYPSVAAALAATEPGRWYQIVDLETKTVIVSG